MVNEPSPVAVGKIVGWFGLKGFVKVRIFNKSTKSVTHGTEVMLGMNDGERIYLTVEDVIFRKKSTLIKFAGVEDRTSAEKFKDAYIFVQERPGERLPQGRWYVHDIIGCEVVASDGKPLGTVSKVYVQTGQDLWEITNGEQSFLLPVVKEFVKKVDIPRKRITVEVIEGLFE